MLNFDDSENFLREHGDYFTTHYYDSAVSPCGSLSSGSAISTIVSGSTESGLNSLATEADACHSAPCSPQKQMTQTMTSAKRASLPNLTSQGGATEGTDVNSESTVIGLCSLNESNHRAEKNMGEKWCKRELKGVAESSFTSGVKKDVKERLLSQKTPSRDQSAVLARLGGVATPSDKVWCQTGPCLVADISKPSELVLSVRNHFADRIPNTSLARLPSGEGKNVDRSSKSNVFTKCSRKHDNREKSTEIVTISQTVNGYGNKEAHWNSHSYANSVQCEHKTKTKPPEYHRNKDMNCDDAKRHRASHSPAGGDSVLKACCDKEEGSSRAGQAIKPDETHTTAVSLGILKSRGQRGLKEISWQSDQTSYETSPPLLQPSMPPCHSYPLQFPPRGVHPVPDYGTLTPSSGLQDNVTRDLSTRQRDNTPGRRLGVLAPPLNDNVQYHAYFLFHQHNRDWVLGLIDKLESPRLGFRCCCHERDFPSSLTLQQSVLFGMKNALKTVIIISDTFLAASWHHIEAIITGGADITCLQRDVIAIMVEKCEVPTSLSELPYLTTHTGAAWWTKLLARLALPDELTISEEALLAISPSFIGIHPELHSTLLLVSMKSRCSCCGKEVIDTTEVPEELVQNGIQIAEEEYREVMCQLMHDLKFRCHIWCYNMPLAITFFTILLGLCLILIPLVETHYFFNGPETGLEFVHGGVVWLCVLTIYMIITHLSRRKMKENTYQSLANVNSQLVKYNILLGVENLGLADCNKYYLHFFYYELEPCLGYMMELLMSLEECSQCYHNNTTTNDVTIDVEYDDVMHQSVSERITVLENANITNASIQIRAEELLLDHSGEFISMLITKKLDRPSKQRHVKGCYCLCQFVEQRLYKCPV